MELDLQSITEEAAEKIFNSLDSKPADSFSDLSDIQKFYFKNSILPIITHIVPIVVREVESMFQKDVEALDSVAELLADLNLEDPDDRNFLAMHLNTVIADTGRKVRHG